MIFSCVSWIAVFSRARARLQTVQTMLTVQTVQTEYFFLTLESLFSVLRSVIYVLVFVIYPQATQIQHPTINSIDKRDSRGKFRFWYSTNIQKSSIKINFPTFWWQMASIVDWFAVCGFISFVQFVVVVF